MGEFGEFEIADNSGASVVYGGAGTSIPNVTTTPANVPAVADKVISGVSITTFNIGGRSLEVSFDGGTTFLRIKKKSFQSIDVKGEPKQLVVKSDAGTIDANEIQFAINFEAY